MERLFVEAISFDLLEDLLKKELQKLRGLEKTRKKFERNRADSRKEREANLGAKKPLKREIHGGMSGRPSGGKDQVPKGRDVD